MRSGIKDIKENCIMQSRSQRDPKKSIYRIRFRRGKAETEALTFGCNRQHLKRTRV